MDAGETVKAVLYAGDYSGEALLCFENGKVARVPLSAYETKTNRKKLITPTRTRARWSRSCRSTAT